MTAGGEAPSQSAFERNSGKSQHGNGNETDLMAAREGPFRVGVSQRMTEMPAAGCGMALDDGDARHAAARWSSFGAQAARSRLASPNQPPASTEIVRVVANHDRLGGETWRMVASGGM